MSRSCSFPLLRSDSIQFAVRFPASNDRPTSRTSSSSIRDSRLAPPKSRRLLNLVFSNPPVTGACGFGVWPDEVTSEVFGARCDVRGSRPGGGAVSETVVETETDGTRGWASHGVAAERTCIEAEVSQRASKQEERTIDRSGSQYISVRTPSEYDPLVPSRCHRPGDKMQTTVSESVIPEISSCTTLPYGAPSGQGRVQVDAFELFQVLLHPVGSYIISYRLSFYDDLPRDHTGMMCPDRWFLDASETHSTCRCRSPPAPDGCGLKVGLQLKDTAVSF